jgi:hypothetical protein
MEEQFVGIALDGGVDFDSAKFMWEASSGDFDAAMELLGQHKQLEKPGANVEAKGLFGISPFFFFFFFCFFFSPSPFL